MVHYKDYLFKTIRRIIISILFSFCIAVWPAKIFSQETNNDPHFEKMQAMKIAYFTEELSLSTKEAEAFWPLYNEFQKKMEEVNTERREMMRKYNHDKSDLSDKEVEKITDDYVAWKKEEAEISSSYHEKFKAVLPPAKVMKLYMAEIQFRNHLIRRMQEEKGGHGQEQGGRQKSPVK